MILVRIGEPFQRSLIEQDTRYATAIQASWEAQMTQASSSRSGANASIPAQVGRYQDPQMVELDVTSAPPHPDDMPSPDLVVSQDPYLTELTLQEQLGDSDVSE